MATERLWLTEPRRKTALATVTAVRRGAFQLDRSLFCPRSRAYRHPQPGDEGVVWTPEGEKRRLVTVFDEDGVLWHRLRDTVPKIGATLQCHLDPERRAETERAHTALHLVLAAWPRDAGALAEDPEVRGGGHIRIVVDAPRLAPKLLSEWRGNALGLARLDRPIARTHVADTAVEHVVKPQPFADGRAFPGPETTRECVAMEGIGAFPCDGTLSERTGAVSGLVVREAHPDRHGRFVVVFRAS